MEELQCSGDLCPELCSLEVIIGRYPHALVSLGPQYHDTLVIHIVLLQTDLATLPQFSQLVKFTLFNDHTQDLDTPRQRNAPGMANTKEMFLHLTERRTTRAEMAKGPLWYKGFWLGRPQWPSMQI